MSFRVFSYGKCTECGYCFGLLKFQRIFFWVLDIPDIFFCFFFLGGRGVNSSCWAQAYVWRKNESSPHGGTATLWSITSFKFSF